MLKQLAGQTAIYGLSTIVPRFLNYLLFPYLTRLMTTGEYGVVTDMYALIPFLLVILTLGLETGYFRFAGKAETPQQKRDIFTTTWGTVSLFALLFFGGVMLFTPQLASLTGYADHPSYIRLVGAIILLDAITAIPFARLRQEGRAIRFMALRILSVCVNLILTLFFYSVLPVLASHGIENNLYDPTFGAGYVLVANLIGSLVVLFGLYPTFRGNWPRIRWKLLRTIMLYSLPLLISGIAGVANEFIDRQMIKYLMPSNLAMDALGIYGAVAKLGVILLLFIQMYRYAAEPYFLSAFKKEDFRQSNAQAMKYFIIVAIAIFLMIMLFVNLFELLMGEAFREGIYVLPIILLSNILAGIWLNLSFWYKKSGETQYAIWITGTGLLFTIGLNIILTPVWGYLGAALARLGCETAMVGVSYYLNRKHDPIPYDLPRIGTYFLLGGAIYGVSLLTDLLPALLEYTIHAALLLSFVSFVVRKEGIHLKALIKR